MSKTERKINCVKKEKIKNKHFKGKKDQLKGEKKRFSLKMKFMYRKIATERMKHGLASCWKTCFMRGKWTYKHKNNQIYSENRGKYIFTEVCSITYSPWTSIG